MPAIGLKRIGNSLLSAARSDEPCPVSTYFSVWQLRADGWAWLEGATKRLVEAEPRHRDVEGLSRDVSRLLDLLEPIERYWAFPGRRKLVQLRHLLDNGERDQLSKAVARINRALINDLYQSATAAVSGDDEDGDESADEHASLSRHHRRPHFEVLVVDDESRRGEDTVRDNLARLRRPDDEFTYEIAILIGPQKDIPAPDVNTNPQVMAWLMDTYSMQVGYSVPPVVTGKPLCVGGSEGRSEATGRGVMIVTMEALRRQHLSPTDTTVVVQGYGNVGSNAARCLAAEGCTVIAVSDQYGGIYNLKGLDLAALDAHVRETRAVVGFPDADPISNDDLLTLPCTVLVPAALENQITEFNAPDVRARIIAEGANGPTSPEADRILCDRGVDVIPDILANAGGVTVSYFEWVQGLQSFLWKEPEVNDRLKDIMVRSFDEVLQVAESHRVSMRLAAYILAIDKVAQALAMRGIYP